MKKKLFTILYLALAGISNTIFARGANEAYITAGLTTPIGNFAATSEETGPGGGFAKPGASLKLNYQHNFLKWLGAVAFIQGTIHPTNFSKLADYMGSSIDVSRSWKTMGVQAGPVINYSLSSNFKLEARATVGISQVHFGGVRQVSGNNARTGWNSWELRPANTLALSYSIGIGAKFSLSQKLFIPIQFDLCGVRASINDVDIIMDDNFLAKTRLKQNLSTVDVGLGIGYQF